MATLTWTGKINNDFSTAANWDETPDGPPASHPPGSGDVARFLWGGIDCRLSEDVTIGGLLAGPGYWGKIDLAGWNLTGSPAADFLLAHSGDFSLGSGTLRLDGGSLGWVAMGGAMDCGTSTVHVSGASSIFARSGDRLNDLLVSGEAGGATRLTFGPGTLGVANWKVSSSGASAVTLDTAEHAPRLVVEGDLAFELADCGAIAVDQSGGAADWEIGGNVSVCGDSTGRVEWNRGNGTVTAAGSATQRWDWSRVAGALEEVVIDKRWGTLILTGGLACRRWTHRLGVFAPGGQPIACEGDFTIEPGGRLAADPGTMDGCAIAVGGKFSIAGCLGARLRLLATAPWRLNVTGQAAARYVDVARCDAAAGTIVDASDGTSIDGGGNLNWRFAEWQAAGAGNVAAAAVCSAGSVAGDVHSGGGPGQVFTPGCQRGEIHG